MTPKQKKEKVLKIKSLIVENGFNIDRWGNYTYTSRNGMKYRVKIMSRNIRLEIKIGTSWRKMISMPIVNIDIEKVLIPWLSIKH